MSLLEDLDTILTTAQIPHETGSFQDEPKGTYAVFIPMNDKFDFSDNAPEYDIHNVRMELFSKGNYSSIVKQLITAMFAADLTITDRGYVNYDKDTGYHQYFIDVANLYKYN